MRISCVLNKAEANKESSNLILFPEGVSFCHLTQTSATYPSAIIVGACIKDQRCHGFVYRNSDICLTYTKVNNDGRTNGSGNTDQNPIIEFNDFCLGFLICNDIQHLNFSEELFAKLRASKAKTKILCIPANMSSAWLPCDKLPDKYHGFYVALCNNNEFQDRCKSFIADMGGKKVSVQRNVEPISYRTTMNCNE